MVQRLDAEGLLNYEKYRGLVLTTAGETLARNITRRHQLLTDFFKLLGLDEQIIYHDVEGMEHHISPPTLRAIEALTAQLAAATRAYSPGFALKLMPVKIGPAFGWARCARIDNSHAELLVTLEVGPRVLGYKARDGENVLRVNEEEAGKAGEKTFQQRGGHRLWVAPETESRYAPDNVPVDFEPKRVKWLFRESRQCSITVRKELTISLGTKARRSPCNIG